MCPEKSGHVVLFKTRIINNEETTIYYREFKKDAAHQIIIEGVAVQELSDRLGVPIEPAVPLEGRAHRGVGGEQSCLRAESEEDGRMSSPSCARSWRSPSG